MFTLYCGDGFMVINIQIYLHICTSCVKTLQIIHFKYTQFIVCQLCLIKSLSFFPQSDKQLIQTVTWTSLKIVMLNQKKMQMSTYYITPFIYYSEKGNIRDKSR